MLSGNNAIGWKIQGQVTEAEQNSATKELPEYLKQKLRARGILKEDTRKRNSVRTDMPNFPILLCPSFSPVLVIIGNDVF